MSRNKKDVRVSCTRERASRNSSFLFGADFVQVVTQYGSRLSDRAQLNTKAAREGEGKHH